MIRLPCVAALLLVCPVADSATSWFDNEAGEYILTALPDPVREARRMDRMQLSDQQPAGRHLRQGEVVTITVEGLSAGARLAATVGFLPMWNVAQTEQSQALRAGANQLRANQSGPLFFRYNPPAGKNAQASAVQIRLEGGSPLPLYVDGSMDAQDWADDLDAHGEAPFVQLLGERALMTLPATVHARDPVVDPSETFAVLDQMIQWQDELAGFDGRSARDQPTRLRLHYLVDFRVSAQDRENFYMYATDQFIGMLDNNTTDLTDPAQLSTQWGIWHETGHTHQQNSWTFEALGEVNVNLFSLYVQERFGEPSQLAYAEDGDPTVFAQAREYLDAGAPDFTAEVDEDGAGYMIKLVMFHQLKEAYGWGLFQDLHKHFRARPLPEDAEDEARVDAFIETLCELSGNDLREFFDRWGLAPSADADARIDAAGYPPPDDDLSQIFD